MLHRLLHPALAFATVLSFALAGCVQKLDPLPVKEVEPGKPAALDPSLAAAGGSLIITRNGKPQIPYATGVDAGCVAAVVLLWVPLDILLGGGLLAAPDCGHYLPRVALIQLESRHAALLVAQKYGDVVVQLPAGTYLVAYITDDKSLVPLRFGFQLPKARQSYDLGLIAIDNGSVPRASVTAQSDIAFAHLMTELPGAADWPKSTALLTQISGVKDGQSQQVYFLSKKSLDDYLSAATLELKDHGMPMLTPEAISASQPAQMASGGAQPQGGGAAPTGPVPVPFKIDDGYQTIEGTARLENGHLTGQATRGGRQIFLTGDVRSAGLSLEVGGALLPAGASVFASNPYCGATATTQSLSGEVSIPMNATCGAANKQITLYLTMPPKPSVAAPSLQTASAGTRSGPVDVPFRLQVETDDPIEGTGTYANGKFIGHGETNGKPFDLTGEMQGSEFSVTASGFLCAGHDVYGGRVIGSGSGYPASGKVSIAMIVPCAGVNNVRVVASFDLPP